MPYIQWGVPPLTDLHLVAPVDDVVAVDILVFHVTGTQRRVAAKRLVYRRIKDLVHTLEKTVGKISELNVCPSAITQINAAAVGIRLVSFLKICPFGAAPGDIRADIIGKSVPKTCCSDTKFEASVVKAVEVFGREPRAKS